MIGLSSRLVALVTVLMLLFGVGCTADVSKPDASKIDESVAPLARIPEIVDAVQPSVVAVLTAVGEGSGVVWDSDGLIVTNHHVIDGAKDVEVAFASGRRAAAQVVASDELSDLAVLRVGSKDLPEVPFAKELPQVGELAITMGNPLGFENTVTAGIVSGIHRNIPGSAPRTQSLINLIQTDAAISPGNSGGALLDARGEVIGINVAYIPPQARAVSIGFAIPSTTVVDVVDQLLEDGTVSHVFFGVRPVTMTERLGDRLDIQADAGVAVLDVVPDGPAAVAGIEPGDVIISIEGERVRSVERFLAEIGREDPGDTVGVTVIRDGAEKMFRVTLAERPPQG